MKKIISFILLSLIVIIPSMAQQGKAPLPKVYNEEINPMTQIDQAVAAAKSNGHNVICQVGGNWCPWCLLFADFITKDADISKVINDNYEYIHVNYPRGAASEELKNRIDNAGRLGFPVLVVMNKDGKVIHVQETGSLEENKGYNKEKVLNFFNSWTPSATVKSNK